jgi:murein DD-endopeptidase MepM/ murein hydrolase activator NlpD
MGATPDSRRSRRAEARRRWRLAGVALATVLLALCLDVPAAHAATAKQLADQLATIRSQVQKAGSAYDNALTKYESTTFKIQDTTKAIALQNEKLISAEAVLAIRADAMYRNDPTDGSVAFLLGAESFDDLMSRMTYIEVISKADSELVGSIKDTRVALTNRRTQLASDQVAQRALLADSKKKMQAMQSQLAAKQAEYQKVLDAFNAQLAKEKASGKVTWLPHSSNGWVFPVQGAHYYSDTFGAPRSGGRKHQGNDIFANRGTPVVAIESGTITSKTGGLGGQTIWLHADDGTNFYYAHLDSYVVRSGRVSAGQLIGRVGNTGNAAGGACHLHFEIHPHGGAAVDPYQALRACE